MLLMVVASWRVGLAWRSGTKLPQHVHNQHSATKHFFHDAVNSDNGEDQRWLLHIILGELFFSDSVTTPIVAISCHTYPSLGIESAS